MYPGTTASTRMLRGNTTTLKFVYAPDARSFRFMKLGSNPRRSNAPAICCISHSYRLYCESFAAVHRKAMSGFGSFEPISRFSICAWFIRLKQSREVQNDALTRRSAVRMPKPFSRSVMYGRSIHEKMCVPSAPASRLSHSEFRTSGPCRNSFMPGHIVSELVKPVSEYSTGTPAGLFVARVANFVNEMPHWPFCDSWPRIDHG